MRYRAGIAIAVTVGAIAVATPIFFSVRLAWNQGLSYEKSLTLAYAQDALRRTQEMAGQMAAGIDQINRANLAPCSPAEIALMRQIDVSSSYIQAVGRLSGDDLICSSLGTDKPIPVGPPTLKTSTGGLERLDLRIPLAQNQPIAVYSLNDIAFLLDPRLALDFPTEGSAVSLAIYVPSSPNHALIASRGNHLKPEWFKTVPPGTAEAFRMSGYIVAIVRAPHIDVAVVSAAPESYARQRVRSFALLYAPVGLLCAICLAWAVMHLSRVKLSLAARLRTAARNKEFLVDYQPIVELSTGRCVGAEALVRWNDAGRITPPDLFIPAAESSGVITLITECVAEIVAADLPELLRIEPEFFVSINLSANDLRSAKTLEVIQRILQVTGVSAANLKVEATEHGFLQGDQAQQVLNGIRALGVEIAIDDFGTGYSSLSRLQNLNLNALKIDKSFVATIGTDAATSQVVPHIINMAHSLRLVTTAEGVATPEQAAFLRNRRIHYAQGSLFGLPTPIESLFAILHLQERVESPQVIS